MERLRLLQTIKLYCLVSDLRTCTNCIASPLQFSVQEFGLAQQVLHGSQLTVAFPHCKHGSQQGSTGVIGVGGVSQKSIGSGGAG